MMCCRSDRRLTSGKLLVKRRRRDVQMNTEVRDLQEPQKKSG